MSILSQAIIFIAFVTSAVLGSTNAQAWEAPRIGVEGRIQEMRQIQWVRENTHTRPRQYVYNDIQDELDRIEIPRKPKGEEHYVGR